MTAKEFYEAHTKTVTIDGKHFLSFLRPPLADNAGFDALLDYDDAAIQSVLREADIDVLACALCGTRDELVQKITNNLQPPAEAELLARIENQKASTEEERSQCREKILAILRHILKEEENPYLFPLDEEDLYI